MSIASAPSSPCGSSFEQVPPARTAWALVALTALGLGLRLVALGDESAWTDEIYSLHEATAPVADLFGALTDRGNPPGYYLLLHGWLAVFGDGLVAARALSAVTGALAIPLVALLARRLGGSSRVALIAAALVAVSPPLVYLGREARVFALAGAVVLLHALAAHAAVAGGRARAWAAYGGTALALFYLHYFAVFVIAAVGLWVLVALTRARRSRAPLVLTGLVVVVGVAPYLPTLALQIDSGMSRSETSWWKHALFLPAFSLVGHTLAWTEQGLAAVAAVLAAALGLVWAPVAVLLRHRPRPEAPAGSGGLGLALALAALAPAFAVAFSLVAPLVTGRYASLVYPAVALVLAIGVAGPIASEPARLGRRLAGLRAVAVVAVSTLTLASLVGLYKGGWKDDWRAVAQAVMAAPRPVYAVPEEAASALSYYVAIGPVVPIIGTTLDARGLRARLDADHGHAWLVVYTYDPRVATGPDAALAGLGPDVARAVLYETPRLRLVRLDVRAGAR